MRVSNSTSGVLLTAADGHVSLHVWEEIQYSAFYAPLFTVTTASSGNNAVTGGMRRAAPIYQLNFYLPFFDQYCRI
jgi:hypothetical protein